MRLRTALLVAVLLLAGLAVPGQAAAPQKTSQGRSLPSLAKISDVRGVVYSNANRPLTLLVPDLPRLQAVGVNHVTLYVYLAVASPTANEVTRGLTTPTDAELGAVIDAVHAAGMTVAVTPLPWYFGGTAWRGGFQPTDRSAFFDSWRFHVNRYAELSEQHDVELFSIGTEQNSLHNEEAQWRRTAAEARQRFSGPLTYMAPVNPNSLGTVKWWDAVDVVSVSPYFSVSQQARPQYGEIRGTWQGYGMKTLRDLSKRTGRKVLIAETGYVSAEFFGKAPHQSAPATALPAPLEQAAAYAAVLDAISATKDRRSFLLGIAWWSWDPVFSGPLDTTYSPRGKPAECVLAQRWATGGVKSLAGLLPCAAT